MEWHDGPCSHDVRMVAATTCRSKSVVFGVVLMGPNWSDFGRVWCRIWGRRMSDVRTRRHTWTMVSFPASPWHPNESREEVIEESHRWFSILQDHLRGLTRTGPPVASKTTRLLESTRLSTRRRTTTTTTTKTTTAPTVRNYMTR